jgi:hypothetical protein
MMITDNDDRRRAAAGGATFYTVDYSMDRGVASRHCDPASVTQHIGKRLRSLYPPTTEDSEALRRLMAALAAKDSG